MDEMEPAAAIATAVDETAQEQGLAALSLSHQQFFEQALQTISAARSASRALFDDRPD